MTTLYDVLYKAEVLRREKERALARYGQPGSFNDLYGSACILVEVKKYEEYLEESKPFVYSFPKELVKRVCAEVTRDLK